MTIDPTLNRLLLELDELRSGFSAAAALTNGPRPEPSMAGPSYAPRDIACLIDKLASLPMTDDVWQRPVVVRTLTAVVGWLRRRIIARADGQGRNGNDVGEPLAAVDVGLWRALYRELSPRHPVRPLILCLLLCVGSTDALQAFVEVVTRDPPADVRGAIEPFGMLFQLSGDQARALFPGLLEGLQQVAVAGLILDYSNFLYRQAGWKPHPAAAQAAGLIELLGQIADRLRKLQELNPESLASVAQAGRQVTESVPLAISLCDTLALIGDRDAIGPLYKTSAVDHRRLRVESAAALARLGEEQGRQMLIAMAAEPIERLRVLAYADELQLQDRLEPRFTTDQARAEAALAHRLAEPTQFGLPPRRLECLDHRRQPWPGFDAPVDCYLFRYDYLLPTEELANIGIAGPVVYTMIADLTGLSCDDLYCLFAGWDVSHPEIVLLEPSQLSPRLQPHAGRLRVALADAEGYQQVRIEAYGQFFEEIVLIASATRREQAGLLLVSSDKFEWIPIHNPRRPLGPTEAFYLFVGHRLFAAFRQDEEPG